eukprot:2989907-Pyramimonas_sp.AAC.1
MNSCVPWAFLAAKADCRRPRFLLTVSCMSGPRWPREACLLWARWRLGGGGIFTEPRACCAVRLAVARPPLAPAWRDLARA